MRSALLPSLLAACALVAAAGCNNDHEALHREVTGLRQDIAGLKAQLARGGGAAGGQAQARARPPAPDPAKVYAVDTREAPAVGDPAAPLTVVMAYEYACPWCDKQRQAFADIQQRYGADVRFVYRPFVVHEEVASAPALAACAADKQGKFAAANEALWRDVFGKRAFERAAVEAAVRAVPGIDGARLVADMDGACKAYLAREAPALRQLGVTGTPAVWVNGRPVPGGYKSLAAMTPLLDEELAKAKQRIAEGTPAKDYYAQWVVAKGLPKHEVARAN